MKCALSLVLLTFIFGSFSFSQTTPLILISGNGNLEQFKNYCSRASTGRAALQRRVPADPSPPSRLQPAAPRLHK